MRAGCGQGKGRAAVAARGPGPMAMTTMMRSSHHHCGHIAGQGQGAGKGNAGAHRHDNDAIVASLSWSLRRVSERESEGGRGAMAHGQCCVVLVMCPCCNDMVALCPYPPGKWLGWGWCEQAGGCSEWVGGERDSMNGWTGGCAQMGGDGVNGWGANR